MFILYSYESESYFFEEITLSQIWEIKYFITFNLKRTSIFTEN